jgi:hypothetical protein
VAGWGQLLGHAQIDHRRAIPGAGQRTSTLFGARLNVGSERLNAFFETSTLSHREDENGGLDDGGKWSAGLEFRLAEQLWAATGLGSERGRVGDETDRIVTLATLRWAVSKAPRWSPTP